MRWTDRQGLTYGQVFVLLLGFCLASGVIFLLGMWVGRDLAERRLMQEEPVVRVPLVLATPTPDPGEAEAIDLALFERLKQKAEERLMQASPVAGTAAPTPAVAQAPPMVPVVQPSPPPVLPTRTVGVPTRAVRPTATARPRPASPPPGVRNQSVSQWADAGWTVEVTATTDAAEARALVQRLRSRGYDAYLVQVPSRQGVTWYRVRVGRFSPAERAKAVETQNRLRNEAGMSGAFVAPR